MVVVLILKNMGVVLILKNMGVVLILKKAPDDLADQFYSHGSWYKNPEESPFAGNNGYPPRNHTLSVIMVILQKNLAFSSHIPSYTKQYQS